MQITICEAEGCKQRVFTHQEMKSKERFCSHACKAGQQKPRRTNKLQPEAKSRLADIEVLLDQWQAAQAHRKINKKVVHHHNELSLDQ